MDLQIVAQKLLDELSETLVNQGIPLPPVIYLAPGNEVAFDCEQLTIHLAQIITNYSGGDTQFPMPHALHMNSAEFWATLVRCVPVPNDNGTPPNPNDMTIAAGQIMRDARAIRRGFEMINQQHLVVPRNVPVTIGAITTVGPSGGFAASTGSFTVQLVDADWIWDSPAGSLDLQGIK